MGEREPSGVPGWFGLGVGVGVLLLTLGVVTAWALIVALGSFAYLQLSRGEADELKRFAPPTSMCLPEDLAPSAHFGGNGAADGIFALQTDAWCVLPGAFNLRLVDGFGREIPVDFVGSNDRYDVAIGWSPEDNSRLVGSTQLTSLTGFRWQNWCGDTLPAPLSLVFASSSGELAPKAIMGSGFAGQLAPTPTCNDPTAPSSLDVTPGLDGYVIIDGEPAGCEGVLLDVKPDFYSVGSDPPSDHEAARSGGFVENRRSDACILADVDDAVLVDAQGDELDLDVRINNERHDDAFIIGPEYAHIALEWTNWCGGQLTGPLAVRVRFEDERGELTWAVPLSAREDGNVQTPPCDDPDGESELGVELR